MSHLLNSKINKNRRVVSILETQETKIQYLPMRHQGKKERNYKEKMKQSLKLVEENFQALILQEKRNEEY